MRMTLVPSTGASSRCPSAILLGRSAKEHRDSQNGVLSYFKHLAHPGSLCHLGTVPAVPFWSSGSAADATRGQKQDLAAFCYWNFSEGAEERDPDWERPRASNLRTDKQKGPRNEHAALNRSKQFVFLFDSIRSARIRPALRPKPLGKDKSKRVSRKLVRAATYIAWHDPHTIAG